MWRLLGITLGALVCSASAAGSEWVYQEQKDAMRDTVTRIATLPSSDLSPAADAGLSATLTIADQGDKGVGIVIGVEGDAIRCSAEGCQVLMKFDAGSIKTVLVASETGDRFFAPWDQGAVAGAIQYTDKLFVEVPLIRSGRQQFAFHPAGLPIKVERVPASPVLQYQYGTASGDIAGLGEPTIEDGDQVCYHPQSLGAIVMSGLSGSGMVCFVRDRLYLVVLNASESGAHSVEKLKNHLDVMYGKGDSYAGGYTTWPKSPDGMSNFTSGAVILGETLIFTDKSLDLLAPERELRN